MAKDALHNIDQHIPIQGMIYTVRALYYRACRQGTVWLHREEEHPVDSLTDLMHPQLCTLECTFTFSAGDRLNKIFD